MIATHLTRFLKKHHLDGTQAAPFSAILHALCEALDSGSSCLPLEELSLSLTESHAALACDQAGSVVGAPGSAQPLILTADDKLYFHRYFAYESEIAESINTRLQAAIPPPADLEEQLSLLFDDIGENLQAEAARKALQQPGFSIISGGPGTGKTTTVVKILRLLQHYGRFSTPDEVLLLAPTGKAADRLKQSILSGLTRERIDPASFPTETSTIQRALGFRPGSINFAHNAENPLLAQVIVVDESSMVDLPLMAKLVRAIAPQTQLILLGDQHQLASVEVGSVLADLIANYEQPQSALRPAVTVLSKSYRNQGLIHQCCQAIKANDAEHVHTLLSTPSEVTDGLVEQFPLPANLSSALTPFIQEHWLPVLSDPSRSVAERLTAIDAFRILTPTAMGPLGTDNLNATVEAVLRQSDIDTSDQWYPGRSIIVQQNDHRLGVFNGDTGLCVRDQDGRTKVAFSTPTGPRLIAPTMLPAVKTAWSLTIHRTQGSEYNQILLALPDLNTDLATRELLYTGISRAKHKATLWCSSGTLTNTIQKQALRASGLKDLI